MNIKVNGSMIEMQSSVRTVQDLLAFYEVSKRIIIVEHNSEIIAKEEYAKTVINDGDVFEIVQFVGGG
ncbi:MULTISPECIES: sulfur carrier protein ThiS [Metabacillus]|jgi:sulfur carrier protein|uniref:Sulfur carrier protein ThiS n=1 Tax=Metabacillus hrfriensis TaxID=3048891 RepID=A0ACD4REZ0_9BACI|nr:MULTISPECIES: sulfur carrier protein ThiS [Metabacillus]UAL53347.1 sulfur carrier protein ThiS [Metabacillus dongyingensis]UOK58852.1 sulfur carrier protein ThiS [Bacillus sp. OVS6]USK29669.1 sulfur carrier protein ThiS [Bacillus sp. CMF21]WHZ58913.1 sulfur carrier protein ThiS [Metabacillus sp. CT-WN-B3]